MRPPARCVPALLVLLTSAAFGCSAPNAAPRTPAAPPPAGATPASAPPLAADPFVVRGTLQEEWLPLVAQPKRDLVLVDLKGVAAAIPPPPASCAAFAQRPTKGPACGDAADTLERLATALEKADAAARDGELASLEACATLPPGAVRALRAEFAPVGCGDALADPLVAAPPAGTAGIVYDALVGHALAGRLERAGKNPPTLAPPHDRKRVLDFINTKLRTWMNEQAVAIEELSNLGARLPYYGRAVAAVEAGIADLRFADSLRAAPVPSTWANDPELLETYRQALETALEPRKVRGKDATLAGFKELAFVGVLRDPRGDRARELLSRAYGGRRIDALDGLLLPVLPEPPRGGVEARLAATLPTFYAGLLLDPAAATKPDVLPAMLARGLSVPHRLALRAAGGGPPEVRPVLARYRVDLGRRYWRSFDFDRAVAEALAWPLDKPRPPELRFVLALALALRGGPEDAADMIRRAPLTTLGIGNVAALDAIAAESPPGPYAGHAAYDAAFVTELSLPVQADKERFRELADRYRRAATLLPDEATKNRALERAKAADAIAGAVSPQ